MNYCQDCIRKQKKSPPTECPECGKLTLYAELFGASMCLSCINCGFEIVGSSFFPQCNLDSELDDCIYALSISAAEKSQYLKIAKAFDINVVQLKKLLDEEKSVIKSGLSLDEVVDIMQTLQNAGVPYLVSPNPLEKYPEIIDCQLR